MSITTTWAINDMKRNASDNGVFEVFWTLWAAREEKYVTEVNGSIELTPDPTSDSFIPFENLTENDVLSWVKNNLEVSVIEQKVKDKLEKLHPSTNIAPTVQSGTPWGAA